MSFQQARLPATFTSLYRLFLRTCSASVLHHTAATRNLRRLWRPVFDSGAEVVNELQRNPEDTVLQSKKGVWFKEWEQRIDNTLALLYAASTSRGLPHRLTHNLALLRLSEHQRVTTRRHITWLPQLPPTSPLYQTHPPTARDIKKKEEQQRRKNFDDNSCNVVGEVVKMSEGWDHVSLGRMVIPANSWKRHPRRK